MKIALGTEVQLTQRAKVRAHFISTTKAQEWDLWVTITFRHITVKETALKQFKAFFKYLNRNSKNVVFVEKRIGSLTFFEKHSSRKGVHIHALVRGVNPTLAKKLCKECEKRFGESWVEAYDPTKGAVIYLANKLFSPRLEHHDFYTIHPRSKRRTCKTALDESKNL